MTENYLDAQIEANLPAYRRYALRLTGNEHDASDLFQRTYERALSRTGHIRDNPLQWMYAVMRSLYLNDLRRRKHASSGVEFDALSSDQDIRRSMRSVDDEVSVLPEESSRLRAILEEELARISPEKAKTIKMQAEGSTYAEIAHHEDVKVGTIRSRLHAARQVLRERLLKYQLVADWIT